MSQEKILRHRFIDRLHHWLAALAIVLLLASGLPPQLGINFDWVLIHWLTGSVLCVLLLGHILRAIVRRSLGQIWFSRRDFTGRKAGKYTLQQKAMHNAVALLALGSVITGVLMMIRIDTPFWERDPYFFSASTWGAIYVVHGLAALSFVSTVIIHVYFSLRPEKRVYLGAMLKGTADKEDLMAHHDPDVLNSSESPSNS